MPGRRCRSCCRSRSASPCRLPTRKTDGQRGEYEPGCLRPTAEGPPVVMSLNPATLQQLSAYVDGELTASDRETVERALQADPRLREVERSMRGLGAAVRALSEAEIARVDFSGVSDRVLGRVSRRPGVLDRFRE